MEPCLPAQPAGTLGGAGSQLPVVNHWFLREMNLEVLAAPPIITDEPPLLGPHENSTRSQGLVPKGQRWQVNESSGGDPSLEVRLEPLWRRSTLVDLAKAAWLR